MEFLQVLILALVQGLTEFLPISSSAHLVLVARLGEWPDQGLSFDIAVHAGTLLAVLVYFRREVGRLARAWSGSLAGRPPADDGRLAWGVLLGSVPIALAGLLFHDVVEAHLRDTLVIAGATLSFGVLLALADRKRDGRRDEHGLGWGAILAIGAAQALALVPGTSRSGVTMTAALFLGLTRSGAARFSYLLSIPAILMAGGYEGLRLLRAEEPVDWSVFLLGALIAALSAYLCIGAFLRFLERVGFLPFAIYRIVLGIALLVVPAFS